MRRLDRTLLVAAATALVAAAVFGAALADTVAPDGPGAEQTLKAAASSSLPAGANDGSLAPADRVALGWGYYENDTAVCLTWDAAAPGNWLNDTAGGPHARPAARAPPSDDAVSAATQQLCSATPSSAVAMLTEAMGLGGANASAMLMALSLDKCPNNQSMPVSLAEFGKVPELQSAATVMRYIDGFVGAFTDVGFSACVTVAALNGTGNATTLVDQEQRWAGQEPIRPRPNWPTAEPPANFNSTNEQWGLGIEALCQDYNSTTREWQNGTLYVDKDVWDLGVARLVEEKGAEICRLGSEALPMLLDAFRAGGAAAKLALAGVQQAGLNNDSCNAIAYGAFEAAVQQNMNTSLANLTDFRLVRDNIVAAAEEIGLAACVTTVYSNGSAVAVEQRHAGIAAGAKEPGKPTTPSDGFTGDGTLVQPDYQGGQTMQLAFDVKSSVQCKVWDERTLTFVPEGAPKEANEYLNLPDGSAYQELGSTICLLGASAGPLLQERFYAGGEAAVVALAAITQTTCNNATAKQAAVDASWNAQSTWLGHAEGAWNVTNTMTLVQNVVEAAREIGLPACFTAAVLNRTGGLVDQEMRWTEGRLPGGKVVTMWLSGDRPQQCSVWDAAAGDFVNGSGPAWPAGRGAKHSWTNIKEFADRMCPQKGEAVPMLLSALDAGGEQAAIAVAALKSYGACVDDQARVDAFDALVNSPQLKNQTVVMRYVHRYIDACNAIGIACCTSVAVIDPDTKQVLYSKQVHTSNSTSSTGGPQATPSPVPPQPEPDSGVNAGAVAGAAVGGIAALACAAGLFVWLRRRRQRQAVAAASAAGGKPDAKPDSRAGVSSAGGATSAFCDLDEDAAAAAAATVPTKPGGSTPASLASLLQALEGMVGGGAAYSASAEDAYLLSYVTSLASQPEGPTQDSAASLHRRSSTAQQLRPWEVDFRDVRLLRAVGAGSFGKVFLGEWHQTAVAVKLLLRGGGQAAAGIGSLGDAQQALALPPQVLQKLDEEAGLLASLRHNNVVNFYGVCHSPPCIITEFCERGSLADLLARARQDPAAAAALPWPRRLSMALDAARGMLYLHSRPVPVLHRDLKSPNLLVDAHFRAKVTDLNLSRLLDDRQHTTAAAVLNPRWLPPEIMRGGHASKAADVFAYGVVLWELLTWQLPWSHEQDPWRIVSSVLAGERLEVPPAEQLPGMPEGGPPEGLDEYVTLLQRCWAQDPEQRPTFADIIPQLRAMLQRAGIGGDGSAEGGASSGGATGGSSSGVTPSATASPATLSGGSALTAST